MLKNNGFLKLSLLAIFSLNLSYAATQATYDAKNKQYVVNKGGFSDSEVYSNGEFQFLQGKNYYAKEANGGTTSDIVLVIDNPKPQGLQATSMLYKQHILTPDIKKDKITTQGFHNSFSSSASLGEINYIPFLVSVNNSFGKANRNSLILKNGELSSVYYLKPSSPDVVNPKASGLNNKYNFLITPAIVKKGEANNNTLTMLGGAYVNMGVENTYTLPLNGAPYLTGAFGIDSDVNHNTVILEKNSKIDYHTTPYKQGNIGESVFDERMTHVLGAITYNGNAKNNKVIMNDTSIVVHGPSGAYSTSAATHIAGAFVDVNNNSSYEASSNELIINKLHLDLRVDTKNTPMAYNALLAGEFFGGKITQGSANKNTVEIKDLETKKAINSNVEIRALINTYGGYSSNGFANDNTVNISLKKPYEINANYTSKNEFGAYGGYATKGANRNTINIKGDLTQESVVENHQDSLNVVAATTSSGKANGNKISINNTNVSIPIHVYGVEKMTINNQDFYANEANKNTILLDNVKSSKNLTTIIEADETNENKINYNLVQSLSSASAIDKGSKIILRANKKANSNTLRIKDYSSAARESVVVIDAKDESAYNKVFLNNVAFSTASDVREGIVTIIGGLSANSHDNLVSINNLNIDEYKNEKSIFIAASGINSENAKSNNNTLFISGNTNIFKDTQIEALAGTILQEKQAENFNNKIAPHKKSGNTLVLNTSIKAKTMNNFDHFAFIPQKNTKEFLSTKDAIYLCQFSSIDIYAKNSIKNQSYTLLKTQTGFLNENGQKLDKQDLEQMLEKISKNHKKLDTKALEIQDKLQSVKFTLSVSDDAKSIIATIN